MSTHFALNWQAAGERSGLPDSGDAASPQGAGCAAPARRLQPLALAVGRRYLPRAVDRNALKRVAREAWRAHWRLRAAQDAEAVPLAFLRLRQAPREWAAMGAGARKRLWRAEIDELLARMHDGARASASATRPARGTARGSMR